MTELELHKVYRVKILTDRGECPGLLSVSKYDGNWRLYGMPSHCVSLWDLVEKKPKEITLKLICTTDLVNGSEDPVDIPLSGSFTVRFFGVEWKKYGCSSQTVFCGGKAEFICDFHVVEADELVPDCVVG